MTDLIITQGIRDSILQVDWEDVCGSVVSTSDIDDYGDYAIVDNFIEKIDDLKQACCRYPTDARSKYIEAVSRRIW